MTQESTNTTSLDCRMAMITPPGEGGISVVRLAGRDATRIVSDVFRGRRPADLAASRGRLLYGHIVTDGETLDEVLVAVVDDDAVEVNCHGGIVAVDRIMAELEQRGARRCSTAYLLYNGVDDIQREAALALPTAHSCMAVKMLLAQHRGELSDAIRRIAAMEPSQAAGELECLLATARLGIALCTPPRVVILGSPNAGKSTLFNRIVGHSRAIVTDVPGTTRDYLSDVVVLGGVAFELVDTAGLRETDHIVEREGVQLSREQASLADIAIYIYDATRPLMPEEAGLLNELRESPRTLLAAANKVDLLTDGMPEPEADICISAAEGTGVRRLEEMVVEAAVGDANYHDGPVVFTRRQQETIQTALKTAKRGDKSFRKKLCNALVSADT